MNLKKKLTVLLTLVALFMAVPATYSTLDAKSPAKKTATSKKKSSAKSSSKPFKGYWEQRSERATLYIDIDLYNPSNYGSFGQVGMSKIDEHEIISVKSINGNTAIIVSECSYNGNRVTGKLTYNPKTGRMSYVTTSGGDCRAQVTNLPRKK